MSLDGVGKVGLDTGAMGSMDMAGMGARVDAARSSEQAQKLNQLAATADASATGQVSPKELARLKAVTQDFESIFLGYMMKTMRQTVPKAGFWGSDKDQADQIFTEMRDDELAKGMAKAGGIGLGKMLEQQLKQTLEMQAHSAALAAALAAENKRKD